MNDKQSIRKALTDFDFSNLFREHLGWEPLNADLHIEIAGKTIPFTGVAEKRGFAVLQCLLPEIPPYTERRKLEHRVSKSYFEHLIIFVDAAHTKQVWQWVRREPNKPVQCREQRYEKGQSGELLLQKLEALRISLEDEEGISLTKVKGRVGVAFRAEKVTKRFFDRFQKEHDRFQGFISGIGEQVDLNWYTSITLNRLMFVYFIQKKGFLDGDSAYLRNRLAKTQIERGQNEFHTFYRYFLLRLFHKGLGGQNHSPELEKLLGKVPYLNGGLFDVHALEKKYPELDIPDQAFEGIFNFFDAYDWHLDERPLRKDNEINPDVLGYIFEKYINQKQMGAYYTKEDITEYISKNTIVPYLFDQARKHCAIAFDNPTGNTVWHLLQEDPDKYIYDAVRTGVIDNYGNIILESQLPDYVQEGMHDPKKRMFDKRYNLQTAGNEHVETLPKETWREYVNRRNRCLKLRSKLQNGEIASINDLITYNLNIRQFAQDVLENWEGSDLIKAFWKAISEVTVLDPTCGSGAFLFAALNILEPLYEACLQRMEAFTAENPDPKKHEDFRKTLEGVNRHPNRQYFIYKSIILNNLYGVDIMDEAVEICKLRLFLKLAAQVEPDNSKNNYGLEPLPDIDFNILAGNTLVGYAKYKEVEKAVEESLFSDMYGSMEDIKKRADDVEQVYNKFRQVQTMGDGVIPKQHKNELRQKLNDLEDSLNHYLAVDYSIDINNQNTYDSWLKSHKPFHWFVEFYGIMKSGGFDVIIGNPPFVEYSEVKKNYCLNGYKTINAGNLYAYVMERSMKMKHINGVVGLIMPLSGLATERMSALQQLVQSNAKTLVSFYSGDANPSRLFEGAKFRLSVVLAFPGSGYSSTSYRRWYAEEREHLFESLYYNENGDILLETSMPKSDSNTLKSVFNRLVSKPLLGVYLKKNGADLLYHNCPVNWIRATTFAPSFKSERDGEKISTQLHSLAFETEQHRDVACCCINSSLFFINWLTYSDCYHLTNRELLNFPINIASLVAEKGQEYTELNHTLMDDLHKHCKTRTYGYKTSGKVTYDEFYPKLSKPIIDKIDTALAQHYGFTDEELDFIINYDIKYRMGSVDLEEEK